MKTADGQAAISVECSGPLTSWQACCEKIGSICGAYGYEVISSTLDGNIIRGNESDKRASSPVAKTNLSCDFCISTEL
jgi:hypothetical protein